MGSQTSYGQNAGDVNTRAMGAGYAHLISFEAEPEIAAANFTVDSDDPGLSDADISAYKLPLYREFSTDDGTWGWYAQGSISYLTLDETLKFETLPGETESLDLEWKAYGALVEFGLIFPFADGFSVAPGIGLGVSRLENDADFSSPLIEDALAPEFEGVLYNWETNASVARGNFALRYDKEHGSYRVKSSANISYSYIDSFSESRKFDGFSDHAATFNLKVDISHPLNMEIRKRPVFIIGHIGNTSFLGSNRDELGFEYFNELGMSLGVDKITFGILGILGDDVTGWTLILNYDY
jgi:hypothetical protein